MIFPSLQQFGSSKCTVSAFLLDMNLQHNTKQHQDKHLVGSSRGGSSSLLGLLDGNGVHLKKKKTKKSYAIVWGKKLKKKEKKKEKKD